MKKYLFVLITLFIFPISVFAKEEVTLAKCVDGDTANFNLNGEVIKARFLAIDTPESTKEKEPYGKEASNYTCETLTKAKKIEIEYDPDSDKTDKYSRHLVWVFVDGELLQEKILAKGLAEVAYLYGDYKYTEDLQKVEAKAKEKKLNIWSGEIPEDFTEVEKTDTEKKEVTKEELEERTWIDYVIIILAAIIVLLKNYKSKKKK
ncbi:MAG: thermonuclease family protein [Bacilli bacterium]|nr:thermonuclease family protein [Bacilli bacterium]